MFKLGHHMRTRPAGIRSRPASMPLRRQRGAFAVMTAALILVMLGFCGLAIDLGRVYNRKVELQALADAVALSAAAELDGTAAGIQRAANAAAQSAARNALYDYNTAGVVWLPNALRFGAAPDGEAWLDGAEAQGQARNLFYVEVDTGRLADDHGLVHMALLQVLPSASATARTGARAVAGRSTINVNPLAICAMSDTAIKERDTELVEYGFRRGVSYNLMRLNHDSNAKGAHFLVNPMAPPGKPGGSVKTRLDVLRPFVCTGTMAMSRVTGGNLTVEHDFPLAGLFAQLNSRFGSYTAPCTSTGAPPDTNVMEYTVSTATNAITWMEDKPAGQGAAEATASTKLFTIAELDSADTGTTADKWGPLWINTRAAKYSAAEPYSTFNATTTDWQKLYKPGTPKPKNTYPSSVPAKTSSFSLSPSGGLKGVADRRILNIPLLRCPVDAGAPATAEALAIGKFYMTVKASEDSLFAEFAGLAKEEALVGQVELYQ
ncbi:MAG TPA: pilus assembly protein TadE [Massilia sp.]|nr:pilus assembly protein TadE [Massilia sp.]